MLLFILIVLPTMPSYLHLLNKVSNPPLITCTSNGTKIKMYTLKGRFFKLESFFSKAFQNSSNRNNKSTVPNTLERTVNMLICVLPSKVDMVIPFLVLIDKKKSNNNIITKKSISLIPSTPPPELILYYLS
ncbi:hypothetical protein [Lutibacter sp.]